MRPWLMVLGAFAAAGGAFIGIANERRRRAPSAASLLAASRRADQQEGLALVERTLITTAVKSVCEFPSALHAASKLEETAGRGTRTDRKY